MNANMMPAQSLRPRRPRSEAPTPRLDLLTMQLPRSAAPGLAPRSARSGRHGFVRSVLSPSAMAGPAPHLDWTSSKAVDQRLHTPHRSRCPRGPAQQWMPLALVPASGRAEVTGCRARRCPGAVTELGAGFWGDDPCNWTAAARGVNRASYPRSNAPTGWRRPRRWPGHRPGLLRMTGAGGGFRAANDPAQQRWYCLRDVAAIAQALQLARPAPFLWDAPRSKPPSAARLPFAKRPWLAALA